MAARLDDEGRFIGGRKGMGAEGDKGLGPRGVTDEGEFHHTSPVLLRLVLSNEPPRSSDTAPPSKKSVRDAMTTMGALTRRVSSQHDWRGLRGQGKPVLSSLNVHPSIDPLWQRPGADDMSLPP